MCLPNSALSFPSLSSLAGFLPAEDNSTQPRHFNSLLFSSRLVSSRLKSSSNRSLLSLFPSETFLLLSLSQLPIASPNPLDRADSSLLSYALLTVC
mgnify:CR=1 FL=1